MARFKEAPGSIEDWLRLNPGPMYSTVSAQRVLRDAYDLYILTTLDPTPFGEFIDHLWGRGLTVEQVGGRWWLKLPGQTHEHKQTVDSPTRIAG